VAPFDATPRVRSGTLRREQLIAYVALGILALFIAFTLITRFQDGSCHLSGRRGGLDCTYPPAAVGASQR
jgi:hypothetical protein